MNRRVSALLALVLLVTFVAPNRFEVSVTPRTAIFDNKSQRSIRR